MVGVRHPRVAATTLPFIFGTRLQAAVRLRANEMVTLTAEWRELLHR
jgi:hypothetical protein